MKERLAEVFRQKSQREWCDLMEGSDVCFAPVLSFTEAPLHPANRARETYIEVDGVTQPAPAPRFSRTPSAVAHGAHGLGEDTDSVLAAMGFGESDIASLRESGAIG
jgi:alpha-methylacyl-CoA racemase